ncbi:hypothetical protein [Roseivivax marinus]|uniref:hypothetical protein n=1 Tax=Roseivivax marinus TaxID=1379903 RepID=UPI00273E4813|nr:hypothetical protein [Roseivivax marinus]
MPSLDHGVFEVGCQPEADMFTMTLATQLIRQSGGIPEVRRKREPAQDPPWKRTFRQNHTARPDAT